ncbi:ABC transporter [Rhodopirellula islandica]|uniref:ABC transporter n=2 Tax=Rhodopirellula islandica TaxID=595434 RepID=A0A0J1BB34_RHOIS|nr:FtsX-like permease family protein [Rhodopirellula islandica]KLU03748.1 ABC transporter [Rhodopirellula islandica]
MTESATVAKPAKRSGKKRRKRLGVVRTSLAWSNLSHMWIRTVVSICGIGFAILLMFMQLGFLGSVGDTATVLLDRMPCDLLVRSPDYLHIYDASKTRNELRPWLKSIDEVDEAVPLDIGVTQWINPNNQDPRAIAVMGIDLNAPAFDLPELTLEMRRKLLVEGAVLVDDATKPDFGPQNGVKFGPEDIGTVADVFGTPAKIVGTFHLGTGLAANGALLCTRETFRKLVPGSSDEEVSLLLIRLTQGVTRERGCQMVAGRLDSLAGPASSATALTIDDAKTAERWRWYTETPIGMIFAMGVVLAVVVGGVISYMILASDVQAHLSEYATLKAMGYGTGFLMKTLLTQSTLLATIAFPPSVLAALLLYAITSALAGVPIRMTFTWLVLVAALSLLMCNAAGLIAIRKLIRAEPANLF